MNKLQFTAHKISGFERCKKRNSKRNKDYYKLKTKEEKEAFIQNFMTQIPPLKQEDVSKIYDFLERKYECLEERDYFFDMLK